MGSKLFLGAAAAALLLATSTARADDRGIIGEDDRIPADVAQPPWQAVGQINVAGHRFRSICTGTLIAPRVVVTAAHCLVTPWDRKPVPAHDVHFVAGVNREASTGHSVAACIRFGPGALEASAGFNPNLDVQKAPLAAAVGDIAIIVLKDNLAVEPVPPSPAGIDREGLKLAHGAYPADRRYQLMADDGCSLLGTDSGLWLTACDTYPASSGGPLFVRQNGGWTIAAVMVGFIDGDATVAWPLSAWKDLPLTPECPAP
ncbi:MAG: trypsin-like serine protease [Hyphomicrobiales bacterium]